MATARVLLCAIGCLLLLANGTLAQQVKLKAALQVPITELLFGRSLAEFKQEVESLTRNGVAIEIFDGGKPYNDTQILGAVTSGDMDLGVVAFNHFATRSRPSAFSISRFCSISMSSPTQPSRPQARSGG
jgi:TRAP-type C4-dicarboxylate transport system substrate-binding protein